MKRPHQHPLPKLRSGSSQRNRRELALVTVVIDASLLL